MDRRRDRDEIEHLIAEGVAAVAAERSQDREALESLVSQRVDVADYESLVKLAGELEGRLVEVDSALGALDVDRRRDRDEIEHLIAERKDAFAARQEKDREDLEAFVVQQVAAAVVERDELRRQLDELVRERVDALETNRESVRAELALLVTESADEIGADVASLDARLVASGEVLAGLHTAVDEVATREVVSAEEYAQVAALAGELETRLGEIDTTLGALKGERSGDREHIETMVGEQRSELVAQIEAIEVDLREQAKALLVATEETLELSIKAADKAESAADNADSIRADHDVEVSLLREELAAERERYEVIEAARRVERRKQEDRSVSFREEIDELVGRLTRLEHDLDGTDEVIDLRERAPDHRGWQFERRSRWGSSSVEQS